MKKIIFVPVLLIALLIAFVGLASWAKHLDKMDEIEKLRVKCSCCNVCDESTQKREK